MTARDSLLAGARALDCELGAAQADALDRLLDELARWNRAYNLTSITARAEMITHHLLDSLSVQRHLGDGRLVADVGTGGGFPGLPLAIVNPARRFTLIDASSKKVRFVAHAARVLDLRNVEAVHARAETFMPIAPFDTVIARAFAALPTLLEIVSKLCGPATRVLAMKGRRPEEELAEVPASWRVVKVHVLDVPGLGAERHLVELQPSATRSEPVHSGG